jgi:hypothetical protein
MNAVPWESSGQSSSEQSASILPVINKNMKQDEKISDSKFTTDAFYGVVLYLFGRRFCGGR